MHDKNGGLAHNEKVMQRCEALYSHGCQANHLLACIIDICQERHKPDEPPESFYTIERALTVGIERIHLRESSQEKSWEFGTLICLLNSRVWITKYNFLAI